MKCKDILEKKITEEQKFNFILTKNNHILVIEYNLETRKMYPDTKLIDRLIQRIVTVVQPKKIILFGSAARGEMDSNSDLDILVIVPDGTQRRRTAQMIYRHMIGFQCAVDIIVATETDLQVYGNKIGLIYNSAVQEGREIYASGK